MARLLGSFLILAGCAGGISCWLDLEHRRQAMMEECLALFVRWDYSLRCGHTRLYLFFEHSGCAQPELAQVLAEVAELLQLNCYPSGRQVWQMVLAKHRRSLLLKGEAYEILCRAGDAFFCGSSSESLHTIRICRERMEESLAGLRREFSGKMRVCISAGMLGGVVLIILLV